MHTHQIGKERIIIAGAGNVGFHLAPALKRAGAMLCQVYSRSEESARQLADILECPFTTHPDELDHSATILILTLNDSAIHPFLQQTGWFDQMLIHTAGSVPMSILQHYGKCFGVLYPLQTFSRSVSPDLSSVPFLTEASDKETLNRINSIAISLSAKQMYCSSEDRLKYHLAAVFCNNFSNHMMAMGEEWLSKQGLPFEILHPLIEETARKAIKIGPSEAQTGPAVRDSKALLELHFDLLRDFPDLQKMYTFVSDSIRNKYLNSKKAGE